MIGRASSPKGREAALCSLGPSELKDSSTTERHSGWLLVAAVLTFELPLLFAPSGTVLDWADFTKYFVPIHEYARHAILSGHWPLWNPYIYAGTPFAANPQTMVFYPPSWLYLLVPVPDAHRFLIVLHALLAAVGMRLYLRRIGLSKAAALAGALPYSLGGYFSTNAAVGHLTMIFAMAWLPLVLNFFEAWRQEGRPVHLVRCGVILSVQFLAGEPQSSYYSGLLLLAYGLASVRPSPGSAGTSSWSSVGRRHLTALAVAATVAILVSAVQLLPTLEMVRESDRAQNSFEFSTVMSMPLESLFAGLILPWYSGERPLWFDSVGTTPLNINREFAIYAGLVPLLLASLSLRAPAFPARLSRAVAIGSVFLMLGRHTPLYELAWQSVPGLAFFRIPSRANILFLWALSVMTGYGMQRIQEGPAPSRRWRAGAVAVIGVTMTLLGVRAILGLWHLDAGNRLRLVPLSDPLIVLPLLALVILLVVLALLPRLPRGALMVGLLALTGLDLFVSRHEMPLRPAAPEADASARRFQTLRNAREPGSGPFRVDLAPSHADALAGMAAGLENVNGYWPVSLGRFFSYVHEMRGIPPSPVTRHQLFDELYTSDEPFPLRLLNVRFASWNHPERRTMVVLEDLKPHPRAWIADRVEILAGERQTLARLRDKTFDPLSTVLLERAPGAAFTPKDGPPGSASVRSILPEEIRLTTRSSRAGYLVVSLPFYPGWKATLDGDAVSIERADYLLTALPLPEGLHEVVLRYEPWSVKAGAAITLAASLLALALEVWSRRNPSLSGRTASPQLAESLT